MSLAQKLTVNCWISKELAAQSGNALVAVSVGEIIKNYQEMFGSSRP